MKYQLLQPLKFLWEQADRSKQLRGNAAGEGGGGGWGAQIGTYAFGRTPALRVGIHWSVKPPLEALQISQVQKSTHWDIVAIRINNLLASINPQIGGK